MKTLLKLAASASLSLALASLCLGADEKMTKKDHIMMKDNKVMVQKDGKVMTLEKDMILDNGTIVAPDGTVTMKGGDKMMLKNGDAIDIMGMKMKHHMDKDKGEKGGDKGINSANITKTTGGAPTGKPVEPKAPKPDDAPKDPNDVKNTKTGGGASK